jgi:hypothetical protein
MDRGTLELRKPTGDLKHQASGRCRGVDRLLIEVEVNAAPLKRLDRTQQVNR